jgi:hypothetical protein
MIRKVSQLVRNGSFTDFSNDPLLKSTQYWLWIINRRMIKGKALSTAFATMFGQVEARSLVDGRIIAVDEYLRTFDSGSFVPIHKKDLLPRELGIEGPSAKYSRTLCSCPQ